jgi:hypothetical protein
MPLTLPYSCSGGMGEPRRRRRWTSLPVRRRTRPTGRGSKRRLWSPRSIPSLHRQAYLRSAYLLWRSPEKVVVCLSDRVALLWPLLPSTTITRPAPAAAGVPRHRRFQHHHRPGAQYRPHAALAWRGRRYRSPSPKSDRRRTLPAPPCHGPPSSRGLSGVHPSLLSPVRVLEHRCNDRHNGCIGASPNLRILGTYISRNGWTSENPPKGEVPRTPLPRTRVNRGKRKADSPLGLDPSRTPLI